MGQSAKSDFVEARLLSSAEPVRSSGEAILWQAVKHLIEAGSSAVGFAHGPLILRRVSRQSTTLGSPMKEAIRRF